MKKILFLLFIFFNINLCFSNPIKFYGNTNYSVDDDKKLNTNVSGEYKLNLYKHKNNLFLVYLGGKISLDYDHFGKEIKTNVFTTFGIDF